MNIHLKFLTYLGSNTLVQGAVYILIPAGFWHNVVALAFLVGGLAYGFYSNPNQPVLPIQ